MYDVKIVKSAIKELSILPHREALKITKKIQLLGENPYPKGCKKLSGSVNNYRVHIGNYRVLYTIEDAILVVKVLRIRHRKNVYK